MSLSVITWRKLYLCGLLMACSIIIQLLMTYILYVVLYRPETNLNPWDKEFSDIKRGSQKTSWTKKWPRAYWKGNPDVSSPIRTELLNCNHSRKWGAQIMRQVGRTWPCSSFHKLWNEYIIMPGRTSIWCFLLLRITGLGRRSKRWLWKVQTI